MKNQLSKDFNVPGFRKLASWDAKLVDSEKKYLKNMKFSGKNRR